MSYGRGKKDNEYARQVIDVDAPKTVWMAIAFSLAMNIREGDPAAAAQTVREEWGILYENGIVPQKPRKG